MDGPMHMWNSNTGGYHRTPVTVITVLLGAVEQTVAQVLTASPGLVLQRRCADVSELLGAAQSGAGMVAVIGCEVRGFDRALMEALRRESVHVVAVNDPNDQYSLQRISALGITHCVRAEDIVEQLPELVLRLVAPTRASLHLESIVESPAEDQRLPRAENSTSMDGKQDPKPPLHQMVDQRDEKNTIAAEETVSRSLIAQLRASIAETEEELFDSFRSQENAPTEITHDSFRPPADEFLEVLGASVGLWGAQDRLAPELEVSSDSPSIAQMRELVDALAAKESESGSTRPIEDPDSSASKQLESSSLGEIPLVEHTFSRDESFLGGDGPRGKVVVVWSPHGAPGRSTIAAALAFSLGSPERSNDSELVSKLPWFKRGTSGRDDVFSTHLESRPTTLLVDADTYAPSQAQALGLLDESSGLAQACRAANQGLLSTHTLAQSVQVVAPNVHLLTGIPRPERWTELSSHALQAVFTQAREDYPWTIVDCAPPLEFDEILSYESRAPQRNSATRTALESADLVVIVGKSDPVSIKRLVGAISEHAEGPASHTPSMVVVNQAPTRVSGKNRRLQVSKALKRFANVDEPFFVGYEPEAALGSLELGQALNESKNRSEFAHSIQMLSNVISAGFVEANSPITGNTAHRG